MDQVDLGNVKYNMTGDGIASSANSFYIDNSKRYDIGSQTCRLLKFHNNLPQ